MAQGPIGSKGGISHYDAGTYLLQSVGEAMVDGKHPPGSRAETIAMAQAHALLEIAQCLRALGKQIMPRSIHWGPSKGERE